jgi:glutathione peroxidase
MTMQRRRILGLMAAAAAAVATVPARAAPAAGAHRFRFESIDGGTIALSAQRGRPVLVVNTASRCAFTRQYDALQALHERYRDRGVMVLAVPSDDFRQELDSNAAVKEFCAVNFGLDLPMTVITPVRGPGAHPFYRWLAEEHGFVPAWNFNKVLIGPAGDLLATWGSTADPLSRAVTGRIEAALA